MRSSVSEGIQKYRAELHAVQILVHITRRDYLMP